MKKKSPLPLGKLPLGELPLGKPLKLGRLAEKKKAV